VLITSGDLLPGGGELNGRRWAGQQLLRSWANHASNRDLALANADPVQLQSIKPLLAQAGFSGKLHCLGLIDPEHLQPWGGLFIPDPSIGRWAQWRQPVGPASFSLIGQIHTLSTPAALGHLQDLVTEPVQPWDAVICSSEAGREVVEIVLCAREEQLLKRTGGNLDHLRSKRPQLPVIPLPLPMESIKENPMGQAEARQKFGIIDDAAVVIWLGRLSLFTKIDPWPTYIVLEQVARKLGKPLIFIECGPDDKPSQHEGLEKLRQLCPSLQFLRLGGDQPVSEELKHQALAAADLAISLVDNAQETFGLAIAEAMAAGLPVVASDWSGYRNLIKDGFEGFLIPTRWATGSSLFSVALGWQQFTGLKPFPAISGAMAQLVQLDLAAAVAAVTTLLSNRSLARAMGAAGARKARQRFSPLTVMNAYEDLFAQLALRRQQAPEDALMAQSVSPQLDLIKTFKKFASHEQAFTSLMDAVDLGQLPDPVRQQRQPLWHSLFNSVGSNEIKGLYRELLRKHLCQLN
jgi:glycosyltransferase involved in cell wall biosynthesis